MSTLIFPGSENMTGTSIAKTNTLVWYPLPPMIYAGIVTRDSAHQVTILKYDSTIPLV